MTLRLFPSVTKSLLLIAIIFAVSQFVFALTKLLLVGREPVTSHSRASGLIILIMLFLFLLIIK